jgi:hypothetical protein
MRGERVVMANLVCDICGFSSKSGGGLSAHKRFKHSAEKHQDAPVSENTGFRTPDKKSIIPKYLPDPTKVYTSNIGRGRAPTLRWEHPEWDLVETGRILDTESYVRRAFRVKKNLFLKEGYEFTGSNILRVRYIKRRFQQMEHATGVPFPILLSETIASLIRNSNAFWVKARKQVSSGGKRRITPEGKSLEPIAGYFLLPAETVRIKRDEYGKIVKYQQDVYGKTVKEFRPQDIVHFYFDKRPGYSVGTPSLAPVKDDIRALRRVEENVELLVYQHLFPLFHYQVGTEDAPAAHFPDGTTEIEVVKAEIASMPSDGCWVTPERHKVSPLQASASPIAVDKVIEHFKQRIFTGLGVSSVDMGEGGTANRSTAQTMSRNLIDDTKADQKEFGALFYSFIIQELLLESTFPQSTILDEENRVYLRFKEIDLESRQAKENHLVDLFLKNAVTHDEMRQMIGLEPFQGEGWPTVNSKPRMFTKGDGDFAKTNYGLFERDKIILQSLDEPGTDAAKAETKSRTQSNSSAGGNSVSNKNTPSNQHGTRTSAKVNKDAVQRLYKNDGPLSSIYGSIKTDVVQRIREAGVTMSKLKLVVNMSFAEARERLTSQALQAYRMGLNETGRMVWEVQISKIDARIKDHIEKYVNKLRDNLIDRIRTHTIKKPALKMEDAIFVELIFDALEHRTKMIDSSEVMRAYNYGLASGHRLNGFQEIQSIRSGDEPCEICNTRFLKYEGTDAIIYEELPPLHPHCTCTMRVTKGIGAKK